MRKRKCNGQYPLIRCLEPLSSWPRNIFSRPWEDPAFDVPLLLAAAASRPLGDLTVKAHQSPLPMKCDVEWRGVDGFFASVRARDQPPSTSWRTTFPATAA